MMGKKACTYCLGISSAIFLVLGVIFIAGGTCIYVLESPVKVLTNQLEEKLTIDKGHITYEQLQNSSLIISKDFYFFNLSNSEAFANTGGKATPSLVEIGPYRFIEHRTKKLIETTNQTELNYTQTKVFIFDSGKSGKGLSGSDKICTINIPLVATIVKMKDSVLHRNTLNSIISRSKAKLYVCLKATDLAWGYTDEFIKEAHKKGVYPLDSFSIQANGSSSDQSVSIINTGIPDITQVGQFIQWNGQRQLDIWQEDSDANQINGTEGLFFKPALEKGENLTTFDEDVMRSFDLVYQRIMNHLGMPTYRYRVDNTTYMGALSEPNNAQYFSWCPDGMFNLGPAQPAKVPIFGSKPHFLDGDPLLLQSVSGLTPDRKKHDTIMDVEPITGVNVFFHRRLQINVQVNKTEKEVLETIHETENISGYNNSGVLYLPVVYVDENAEIDQDFRNYLETKGLTEIYISDIAVPVGFAVTLICGVVFLFVSVGMLYAWRTRCNNKRSKYDSI